MSIYFMTFIGLVLCIFLYRRYFPVLGIPCGKNGQDKKSTVVLDLRDYNSEDLPDNQSDIRVPYAYLKRFVKEIPDQKLHIIAMDRLELNLGVRYLVSKGYQIASYQLSNCPCRDKE
ncbi:sulfurtransferase [Oceanobacillus saliphilus]|uniref:sulfurtransferase n=1 Tax=Oceanobacillus saliphilus TaxID=2925834 RepID=UPI00201D79DF|nr:sulfurtransferase [Oceanobacillus saliphilus]